MAKFVPAPYGRRLVAFFLIDGPVVWVLTWLALSTYGVANEALRFSSPPRT
jgi:hypothetical protein